MRPIYSRPLSLASVLSALSFAAFLSACESTADDCSPPPGQSCVPFFPSEDASDSDLDSDSDKDTQPRPFQEDSLYAATAVSSDDGKALWLVEASNATSLLRIELYASLGGPEAAGTFTLSEDDSNYATCGVCVIYESDCEAHGDHMHCEHTWMPQAGALLSLSKLDDSPGGTISGTLSEVYFQPVTIADDYQTNVLDGAGVHLADWHFEAILDHLHGSPPEPEVCSGHGHRHGSHCHCDSGYHPDPADVTRCLPDVD